MKKKFLDQVDALKAAYAGRNVKILIGSGVKDAHIFSISGQILIAWKYGDEGHALSPASMADYGKKWVILAED